MQTSFSYTTKAELAAIPIKNPCCRRAMTFGLLYAATADKSEIRVGFSHDGVSDLFGALVKETFGKETSVEKKTVVGRETWFHRFSTKRVLSYVEALDGEVPQNFIELVNFKCSGCRQSFLRGIFLGIGTVTDPAKAFHAELLLNCPARAEKLDEFLALCGIPARRIERRGRIGLYYKNTTLLAPISAKNSSIAVLFL